MPRDRFGREINYLRISVIDQCNLRCVYCQNWEISQEGAGREMEGEELADLMLQLQGHGCHNINLVSPSHVVAQSLEAIWIAAQRGLELPIVFNSGGYDSVQGLALMEAYKFQLLRGQKR